MCIVKFIILYTVIITIHMVISIIFCILVSPIHLYRHLYPNHEFSFRDFNNKAMKIWFGGFVTHIMRYTKHK